MGVDQNGRDTKEPDAGPDASGAKVKKSKPEKEKKA